ncbi:hypothetical protein Aca07nite_54610 [Actinoplanes capillaceus]|uniref:Uncharacterized protein n=1 Tax=Actinoplanes campanulatus TaxID=113559 RepID=A0ABQ3WPK4_9ACTN|nr:DUF6193 family natural product biosynthesis protein [Actinoplanes capillaceus]GID48186.1 hypothetical protein Aca07nite_54610 [Actinoplanes capillaceus]
MTEAREVWQAEFDRAGIPRRVRVRDTDAVPRRRATVVDGARSADLGLEFRDRPFYLVLRDGWTTCLQGFPPDAAAAAAAADRWLGGERPGPVAAAWPFLGSVALAEARERGDRGESRWLWLYENHCSDPIGDRLAPFVALAFHEPRLRALPPLTSHFTLHFGRDSPLVTPVAPGRFRVRTRDGRAHDETDAAGALEIMLADLTT